MNIGIFSCDRTKNIEKAFNVEGKIQITKQIRKALMRKDSKMGFGY